MNRKLDQPEQRCTAETVPTSAATSCSAAVPYYSDNACTIYCGDARDIVPALKAVELVATDPPYPNGEDHFLDGIGAAMDLFWSFDCDNWLVFWSERSQPPVRSPLVATHIWHRTNVNGKVYEPVYHFARDGKRRRSEIKQGPAIFDGAGPGCREYLGHPTQKPVHIMRWLIGKHDGTILDPFMGVGSTLLAAKLDGRKAIGVEIDEQYCEIAANRLRNVATLF